MLHSKARKLMVEAYERTHNAKEVAECYSVDESTVYRLERQKKVTGSVELRINRCGRKPFLPEDTLSAIDKAIQERPDITIDEIIENLDLHVTNETVRKAVIKMGYVRKKNLFTLLSVNAPNVRKQREELNKFISEFDGDSLVYFDESGVTTNLISD